MRTSYIKGNKQDRLLMSSKPKLLCLYYSGGGGIKFKMSTISLRQSNLGFTELQQSAVWSL